MNWTIPTDINYSIINHQASFACLNGKTDFELIGQYCSIFSTLMFWSVLIALILLFTENIISKLLLKKYPGLQRFIGIVYFAFHAGTLLFILISIIKS